jgi:O-antigen ligase
VLARVEHPAVDEARNPLDFAGSERPEVADVKSEAVGDGLGILLLEPPSTEPRRSSLEFFAGRSPIELFAAATALLIPIAYSAGLEAEAWSARAAILLVVSAVGLPLLWRQARGEKPLAARAAVAFLLVGLVSAILSHNHTTAFFGLYNQGTGLLFMAGLAAAWAIGRSIRPDARPLVERALIIGVLVNVGVALVASIVDLSSLSANFFDESGRSSALAGNPVHLGALAVLGLALFVPRFASSPSRWAIPVLVTAASLQLSGTRVALAVTVAIVLWAVRRHGLRIGAALALFVLLGLAAGGAIGPSGVSATGRAAAPASSGGLAGRPATWLSARHAFAQRPLLGVGPGQFRTATSPYRPITVARQEGPDKLFTDAHNLFVEYATTTGAIGVTALLVWLVAATRRTGGCLLAGALGLFVIHLVEPQSVVTTPIAFLALGASASYGVVRPPRDRRALDWIIPTCCIAVAVSLAGLFLLGEFDLRQATLDLRLAPVRQADSILPAWPRAATLQARVWLYAGIVGRDNQADYRQSRSWRQVAIQRDNTDPALWNDLAELDEGNGLGDAATAEYLTALRFNPTSARAMNGLSRLAQRRCDVDQQRFWHQRSLAVSPAVTSTSLAGGGDLGLPTPACAGAGHP